MNVERKILELIDCEKLTFSGRGRTIVIIGDDAQHILINLQETIRFHGSSKNRLKVINGDVEHG